MNLSFIKNTNLATLLLFSFSSLPLSLASCSNHLTKLNYIKLATNSSSISSKLYNTNNGYIFMQCKSKSNIDIAYRHLFNRTFYINGGLGVKDVSTTNNLFKLGYELFIGGKHKNGIECSIQWGITNKSLNHNKGIIANLKYNNLLSIEIEPGNLYVEKYNYKLNTFFCLIKFNTGVIIKNILGEIGREIDSYINLNILISIDSMLFKIKGNKWNIIGFDINVGKLRDYNSLIEGFKGLDNLHLFTLQQIENSIINEEETTNINQSITPTTISSPTLSYDNEESIFNQKYNDVSDESTFSEEYESVISEEFESAIEESSEEDINTEVEDEVLESRFSGDSVPKSIQHSLLNEDEKEIHKILKHLSDQLYSEELEFEKVIEKLVFLALNNVIEKEKIALKILIENVQSAVDSYNESELLIEAVKKEFQHYQKTVNSSYSVFDEVKHALYLKIKERVDLKELSLKSANSLITVLNCTECLYHTIDISNKEKIIHKFKNIIKIYLSETFYPIYYRYPLF